MIKNIKLIRGFRKLIRKVQKSDLVFGPNTVILGENASGKSTVLSLISERKVWEPGTHRVCSKLNGITYDIEVDKRTHVLVWKPSEFLDTSKLGANVVFGAVAPEHLAFLMSSPSMGEQVSYYFAYFWSKYQFIINGEEDYVVLIDEPENSNSGLTQDIFVKAIRTRMEKGQIIIATHSPVFIVWASTFIELVPNWKSKLYKFWKEKIECLATVI